MNTPNSKYRRSISSIISFCYLLLLFAAITDLHIVDISFNKYIIEPVQQNEKESGYIFSDESGCIVHQAYSSINQVVFYSCSFRGNIDYLKNFVPRSDLFHCTNNLIPGSPLRAPPVQA